MKRDLDKRLYDMDRVIGTRIRERRILLGIPQQELADRIGVAYQQLSKYERGTNRLWAARLFEIALVLNVPLSFFFEGFEDGQIPAESRSQRERICLDTARSFSRIPHPSQQEAVHQIIRSLLPAA